MDKREREIFEVWEKNLRETEDTPFYGWVAAAYSSLKEMSALIDRERGWYEEAMEGWEDEKKVVAELVKALEEHHPAGGPCACGYLDLKEQEMPSRSAVGHMGFSENLKVIPEEL